MGREIVRVQIAPPNEITSLVSLPGKVAENPGLPLSADGKGVIVSVSEEKSNDVWLMENFDPSAGAHRPE